MNPIVLLILMALMAADALAVGDPLLSGWAMPAVVVGAFAGLIVANGVLVSLMSRRMDLQPQVAAVTSARARAVSELVRWLALVLFAAALFVLGWLDWLRDAMGGLPIVPDVIAVIPPLVAVAMTWWWWYAVDARLRQATLVRELDTAGPPGAEWSRFRFTLWHVRHQMGMFLLLVGVIGAWGAGVEWVTAESNAPAWVTHAISLVGGLGALILAPIAVRLTWDIERLADGSLRDKLLGMCEEHGVRVRDLLVWRTHGGVINAAVIGFLGRLRYIIVTDGMIERLDDHHIEAIMAHELGHIRWRHLPWILVCAVAILLALTLTAEGAMRVGAGLVDIELAALPEATLAAMDVVALAVVIVLWIGLFGIVSRQMERQADTFAAQHMASHRVEPGYGPGIIGPISATMVAETLRRVAALNHIPAARRAWRHGSIASRANYLESLAGRRIDACPIDRKVRRTCIVCFVLLAAVITAMTMMDLGTTI